MATATFRATSTGVGIMQNNRPQPRNHTPEELKEVVRKIHALRRVDKTTGFYTRHTIVELLSEMSTDDLIAIGEALKLKPREMPQPTDNDARQQPIYQNKR